VELKKDGSLVRRLQRKKNGSILVVTDGHTANNRIWHLIRGEFLTEADKLRTLHPNRIEPKRSAEVIIAIPELPLDSGLLFATLPTQQRTGLPFHLNADFYPTEDRKRIILEQDFQSQWNRAAIAAGASALAGSLDKLPTLLGHQRFWELLARVKQVVANEEIFAGFWSDISPSLASASIIYTNQKKWRKPNEVFYLQQASEKVALPVLEDISLNFVHEDLRPHQNLFTSAPINVRRLTIQDVVAGLKQQGLTTQFQRNNWPPFLKKPAALRVLWEEIIVLLNPLHVSHLPQHQQHPPYNAAIKSLSTLALAVSRDGALCPCITVYRAGRPDIERIFSHLDPTIRFAAPETNSFPLFTSLCPEFGPAQAIRVLQKTEAVAFAAAVTGGFVSVSGLFSWLVEHRAAILHNPSLKTSLAALSIYPSAGSYCPLTSLSLPGDFEDPLQLAALLNVNALSKHHDFLRELGIKDLSFAVYVSQHLIPALRRRDLLPAKRRAAVLLVASRRSEITEDQGTCATLASLALVECGDDQFHAASEVYFPGQIVAEVLGDTVLQAKLPVGHETIFTEMFKWLGVAEHPRYEDIVSRIKTLVVTPPTSGSLASIQVIFAHLANRLQNDAPSSALNGLRTLAWLPARQQAARWFKPAEIYAEFSFYLFDSQADFLNVDRTVQNSGTVLLTFLGVKSTPSVSQVVAHLLHCAQAGTPVNQEVYAFLNNNADDPNILQLRSHPCLLLTDGHYIHPGGVFWSEHSFGRFRKQLGPELRKYNDFFQRLGVSEKPNHHDALKVLSELTSEFGSRNRSLDDAAHAVALACWRMLESALESATLSSADLASLKDARCVPNATHNLTPPTWIFFEDRAGLAAKFEGFLATNAIPRPLGAAKAMAAAGVRTLATAVEVSLLEFPNPVEDPELARRIQERRLQLARVLDAQAAHTNTDEKLTKLDHIRFEKVDLLKISYKLNAFARTLTSTPEDCPALFRAAEGILFFVAPNNRVPWTSIARELALALNPDEEPGRIASGLKEVLSAETTEEAKAVLDELGFSTLEATSTTPVAGTETIGELGGQTTTPDSPPVNEPPPLTPGQAVDAILGPDAKPPTPPPPGLDKPDLPEGQPTGVPGATGGKGGKSGPSGPGTRPPAPQRGKLRSYVVKNPTPSECEPDPAKVKQRGAIANAGVAKVVAYETEAKRNPKEMPPQHPGYDIESHNASGEVERFIEVKSISGYWGTEGVGLTSPEFFKACELGDRYWLYVVERADQPDARIYCIQNPARKVDQFLYDDGWQQAATENSTTHEPQT